MRRTLLTNGDSWTFGCEIIAPEFMIPDPGSIMQFRYIEGFTDYSNCNDYYRIPKIWSTHLGKILDADVVNLAVPGRSNDTIFDNTIHWIMKNYITPGKDTKDLIVIIGWSSPERKNIMFNESIGDIRGTSCFTLWPQRFGEIVDNHSSPIRKKFIELYVTHQWLEQEYIKRFVEQNYHLQNFLKLHNIKYKFFNSFWSEYKKLPWAWKDPSIPDIIKKWNIDSTIWLDQYHTFEDLKESLLMQWNSIDNFIDKDKGTFRSYIYKNVSEEIGMNGMHPSPEGHKRWAIYLSKFI